MLRRNPSGHTGLTPQQFASLWDETGGRAKLVSEATGMALRNVYERRNKVEAALGRTLPSAGDEGKKGRGDAGQNPNEYLQRVPVDNFAGSMVVFSDAHYWKGQPPSVAHQALIEVIREIKPKLVIANGDIFDGARISRFPRNGWENLPRISDELEEATERMAEVRHAAGRARLIRTIGNHDIRFDRYLSMNASEMDGIAGFRLADHLMAWPECMSVAINGNTMVKHRFYGGINAAYNATLRAGWNTFNGHTHHLEVKPWGDYNGRRYGTQTGAIAEVCGPQFAYGEDGPTAGCSGFAVGTFDKDGRLLMPELCEVIEGVAYFRGQRVAGRRRVAA
jgi:hypothetical protein